MLVAQALSTIALGLLGLAGVGKLIDPKPTSGALSTAGLPSASGLVRLLGLWELGVATAAILGLAPAVWAAAATYLGFFAFVLYAQADGTPLRGCGCFGSADTPPTPAHAIFNGLAVLALGYLGLVAAGPVPSGGATAVIGFLAFAGIGTYASYLVLAVLPDAQEAARP